MIVCTAQAVPREYQLTFGCNRLQELEYFCMLQSTQQFYNTLVEPSESMICFNGCSTNEEHEFLLRLSLALLQ